MLLTAAAPEPPASPGTLAAAVLLMMALPQQEHRAHLQPATTVKAAHSFANNSNANVTAGQEYGSLVRYILQSRLLCSVAMYDRHQAEESVDAVCAFVGNCPMPGDIKQLYSSNEAI